MDFHVNSSAQRVSEEKEIDRLVVVVEKKKLARRLGGENKWLLILEILLMES
jgi:hypothetical protein